jgi:hypothetical protein
MNPKKPVGGAGIGRFEHDGTDGSRSNFDGGHGRSFLIWVVA